MLPQAIVSYRNLLVAERFCFNANLDLRWSTIIYFAIITTFYNYCISFNFYEQITNNNQITTNEKFNYPLFCNDPFSCRIM